MMEKIYFATDSNPEIQFLSFVERKDILFTPWSTSRIDTNKEPLGVFNAELDSMHWKYKYICADVLMIRIQIAENTSATFFEFNMYFGLYGNMVSSNILRLYQKETDVTYIFWGMKEHFDLKISSDLSGARPAIQCTFYCQKVLERKVLGIHGTLEKNFITGVQHSAAKTNTIVSNNSITEIALCRTSGNLPLSSDNVHVEKYVNSQNNNNDVNPPHKDNCENKKIFRWLGEKIVDNLVGAGIVAGLSALWYIIKSLL
jgi:hypothetical protein